MSKHLKKSLELQIVLPAGDMEKAESELMFIEMLSSYKNFLVFSPHFDDAVLSVGSLLTTLCIKNAPIQIINVFTQGSPIASPFNENLLRQAEITTTSDYFLTRKNEDEEALKKLGKIERENLGFTDAAWRIGNDKNLLYPEKVLTTIKEEDNATISLIEKRIQACTLDSTTAIFAPLARGNHVDHQIVRNVATKLFPHIIYYSDFPYTSKYMNENDFITKQQVTPITWHGEYKKKKDAVLTYKSQFGSFLDSNPMHIGFECFYFNKQV